LALKSLPGALKLFNERVENDPELKTITGD
jgi:hypothetical protein